MNDSTEQQTPIDRPLMRSDINDLRESVRLMGDRQLQMLELAKGFSILHDEVVDMKRSLAVRLWAPTIANTIVLLLNVAFVLWSRIR